jgi:hypothetical protein
MFNNAGLQNWKFLCCARIYRPRTTIWRRTCLLFDRTRCQRPTIRTTKFHTPPVIVLRSPFYPDKTFATVEQLLRHVNKSLPKIHSRLTLEQKGDFALYLTQSNRWFCLACTKTWAASLTKHLVKSKNSMQFRARYVLSIAIYETIKHLFCKIKAASRVVFYALFYDSVRFREIQFSI